MTNLFGLGLQSKSPNVTAVERQNCYYEFTPQADRTQVSVYGTPGLDLFVDFGALPWRGIHVVGNLIYGVLNNGVYTINNAGTITLLGTILTSTGRVSMADNGTQVMIVDNPNGYVVTISNGALAQITNANYPGAAFVTYQDGYFIINVPNTQKFYLSNLNDGTTWQALMFSSADSNPDNLVACLVDHEILGLYGTQSIEFWTDTGALDFPYSRVPASTVEWGLAAVWSLKKFDNGVIFLASVPQGGFIVAEIHGFKASRVSTTDLEYDIEQYASVGDATGVSYILGGHPMYQLNFPSAGYSWLYDGATQLWSKMKSYGLTRHRAEIGVSFLNQFIVSDYSSGKLYKLDPNTYTDNGDLIEMELITKHVFLEDKQISIASLQVDCETGVGTTYGQGSAPQMMLQISKDGGHTWGTEMLGSMGALGQYASRCIWRVLGISRDWTFKLRITDPVKRVLFSSQIHSRAGIS